MPDSPTPDELRARLVAEHDGLKLWLSRSGDYVVLSQIVVADRGRGTGTAVMEELVAEADRYGWPLACTPSNDFGGSKSRLVEFYRRFGFVPNKGRDKDFGTRETMIRPPGG